MKREWGGGVGCLGSGRRLLGELGVVLGFVETRTMGLFIFCHWRTASRSAGLCQDGGVASSLPSLRGAAGDAAISSARSGKADSWRLLRCARNDDASEIGRAHV